MSRICLKIHSSKKSKEGYIIKSGQILIRNETGRLLYENSVYYSLQLSGYLKFYPLKKEREDKHVYTHTTSWLGATRPDIDPLPLAGILFFVS